MIRAFAVFLCWSTAALGDGADLNLWHLNGVKGWFPFDQPTLQTAFPKAQLERGEVADRLSRATPAIRWMQDKRPLVVFEGTKGSKDLFSIWTEHEGVAGPFGLRVGHSTLADALQVADRCGRGRTFLSDSVVCLIGTPPETAGSLIFRELPGGAELAAPGDLASQWDHARLSRIIRFRGSAECDAC